MRDTHLFYGVPADGQDGGAGSKHSVFDGDRPEKVADQQLMLLSDLHKTRGENLLVSTNFLPSG